MTTIVGSSMARRLDANEVLDMLSDADPDDCVSDDDIGEPMCPGSDDELYTRPRQ